MLLQMLRILGTSIALTLGVVGAAAAEWELSVYGGYQTAPHSRVTGNDPTRAPGSTDVDFLAAWEGRPFDPPPYYGLRATRWLENDWGFGVEVNHAKVYADDASEAAGGFSRLELSDGHNLVTVNALRRFPDMFERFTPYVGGGVGLAIPHVDAQSVGGPRTFGYQVTGPAIVAMAGVSYAIDERWSVFTEYKGSYSQNEMELEGGGRLRTDLVTNAINFGVSFSF